MPSTAPPASLPVVYSATWCGHCARLKGQLDRAGVAYRVVDVDEEPEHLPRLSELNGGSWLIPTVELPDGTALVNPSAAAVAAALAGSGA
jgi:mycoredoxin